MKAADYESEEKQRFARRICGLFIAAIIAFILYIVLNFTGLSTQNGYEQIASSAMGLVGGTLLAGALYTSGYMAKIKAFKKRLLQKSGKTNGDEEDGDGEKRNRVFCTILSFVLFAVGIGFGVAATLGHTSAYSAAISCLCAATVIAARQKR